MFQNTFFPCFRYKNGGAASDSSIAFARQITVVHMKPSHRHSFVSVIEAKTVLLSCFSRQSAILRKIVA